MEAKRVLTISLPKRGRDGFVNAIEDFAIKNEYTVSEQIREIIKDRLKKEGYTDIK